MGRIRGKDVTRRYPPNTLRASGNSMGAMRVSVGPDDLQANAAWVRRLADYLVREGGEADDLAQETLVAALHSPRPMQMPLTTWLGGILRNVARARARSDRRRRALEHTAHDELAVSAGSAPLGPDDLLERMELHQLLGRMVLELDEPYRNTVLLRYYEGLSAADIAARTGVPAGTVRWRLKQGLDGIRRKLDDRWSRREDWIAVVAPLAICPVVPTALSLGAASAGGFGFLAWSASGVTLAVSVAAAVCMRPAHPDRVPVAATIEPTLPGESLFTTAGEPAPSMCSESDRRLAAVPTSVPRSADIVTSGATAVAGPVSAGGPARAWPAQSPSAPLTSTKPLRYQVPLGSGPIAGPSDAKVTVLVFMGYECPFSRKADETISRLLQRWPRDVRVQAIQAPLREHANAVPAAKAVLAAGEQGKYWEMHRLLFASSEVLERSESNPMPRRLGLSPSDIDGYARKLGLDRERFHRDAASVAVESALEIDKGTTDSLGTPFGTPTFFINGRRVNGSLPNEVVDRIVNEELSTADQLLASGVSRAELFNEIVGKETAAHHRATVGAAPVRLDPVVMDQVAGGYMIDNGRKILVERADDHLTLQRPYRPPLDLLPQSPSSFLFTDDTKPGEVIGSSHVVIVRGGGGRVTGLEMRYPEGTMQRAWRIDPTATSAGKVAPLEPRPASAANDDFESGSLTGWRVDHDGAGGWYVYANGKSAPAPLHSDRKIPFDVPDPPQGKFAAVTDMDAPGTLLLYRDVLIDGPYRMQLELFYVTPGRFTQAAALDHASPAPNQQIRIDLVTPSAPLHSVAEEHVVASIFRTSPGAPHQRPPTSLAFDLSPLQGRTLRLRLAVVNNTGPIRVGVDDIRFERMGD